MTDDTQLLLPEGESVRRWPEYCARCGKLTAEPVVVSTVHGNSGPGFNVYACPRCAPHFEPVPDVDDLLANGLLRRLPEVGE
jgi:ribosomal protein S27AE